VFAKPQQCGCLGPNRAVAPKEEERQDGGYSLLLQYEPGYDYRQKLRSLNDIILCDMRKGDRYAKKFYLTLWQRSFTSKF
jgi:hypothetical protein